MEFKKIALIYRNRNAQVTVELLLVLPVFFLMLFIIMEFGMIAHKVIVVNHAAYEIARIGALLAGPTGGDPPRQAIVDYNTLNDVKCQIFGISCGQVLLNVTTEVTGYDPQVGSNHTNEDIIVTLVYPVKLIFPVANYVLADPPRNRHIKKITVSVRMPVEKPLYASKSF